MSETNEQKCLEEIMVNSLMHDGAFEGREDILDFIIAIIDTGGNQVGAIYASISKFVREMFNKYPDISIKYIPIKGDYRLYIGRTFIIDKSCPFTLQDIRREIKSYLPFPFSPVPKDSLGDSSLEELITLVKEYREEVEKNERE